MQTAKLKQRLRIVEVLDEIAPLAHRPACREKVAAAFAAPSPSTALHATASCKKGPATGRALAILPVSPAAYLQASICFKAAEMPESE